MYIQTDEVLKIEIQNDESKIPFYRFIEQNDKYAGLSVNWHWHKEVEILYVKYGQLKCSFRGGEVSVSAGDAVFINSGLVHGFENTEPCLAIAALFDAELIAPADSIIYEQYIRPVLASVLEYRVFKAGDPSDELYLRQIHKICESGDIDADTLEIQLNIGRFWLDFYNSVKDGLAPRIMKTNKVSITRLRTMIYYIMQNYSGKIALQDMAKAAKISKSEALRCFRTGLETTPVQFLTEYRISRACDLLRSTDKSITEIAEMTGFENSGYFCKVFKKARKASPKDYRRSKSSAASSD